MIIKVFRVHSSQVLRFDYILPFSGLTLISLVCWTFLSPYSTLYASLNVEESCYDWSRVKGTLQGFAASSSLELSRSMI